MRTFSGIIDYDYLGIGVNIDGEYICQFPQLIQHPSTSMLKALPYIGIFNTKLDTADAAGDLVVVRSPMVRKISHRRFSSEH
jgi:hypothetical protein